MIMGTAQLNPNVVGTRQKRFRLTTQNERLFNHFLNGGKLTPLESWNELGIYRLASRIHEIRNGHCDGIPLDITGTWVVVQNQFGEDCRVMRYYATAKARNTWRAKYRNKSDGKR